MVNFNVSEAAKAVNGILINNNGAILIGVSTDSRDDLEGKLFVPIVGEFFDGHDFIIQAFEKQAVCIISEKNIDTYKPYILVNSTKQALMDLARWYRKKFHIPVVAITGSVGKTTTKDMIASVLATKYNVLKNIGNLNNEIGLPLTVFHMDYSTEIAVLEMGMNSFGEISNLSKIATPKLCVITNIGVAHMANLGSREGILQAKSEIFDYMAEDGVAILNGDDDMLVTLENKKFVQYSYGIQNGSLCKAKKTEEKGIAGTSWEVTVDKDCFQVDIPLPGDYMIYNAMAAVCCGKFFNISNVSIAEGIRNFKPSKNRMDIFETQSGITVINDVYNANPVSMKAVIGTLRLAHGRKVCVLGDMLELGDNAPDMHLEIGRYAAEAEIDTAIFIGELGKCMAEGFKEYTKKGTCHYFTNLNMFVNTGMNLLCQGDTVLVKASRGMQFEKIIEKLTRC